MNNDMSDMKQLEDNKLADVIGGKATSRNTCPHCGSTNIELAPNTIDPDGNVYANYRCRDCGQLISIKQ